MERPDQPSSVPTRSRAASSGETSRVDAYLRGDAGVHREVNQWIRIELQHRYPGLRGEHDDLGQIVHEKLLANLRAGRYEGRSALRTYVTGITQHTAIDRVREVRRQQDLLSDFARESGLGWTHPSVVEKLDEPRLLHRVVVSLPATCRELWALVFVDGLGYDEIGKRLAIPAGTVKSRMWHCRRKAIAALDRLRRAGGRRR